MLTDWLLAQRQRLVIVAIVTAPLLPMLTAALLALETNRRGARQGAVSAAFGVAGLSLLAVLSRTGVLSFALFGLVSMGLGVAIGVLIRWAGNLVLAFQVVWLFCFVAVLAFVAFGPDPAVVFAPILDDFKAALQEQPGNEAQVAEIVARTAQTLPAATLLFAIGGTMLLAYWWCTVADGKPRFAVEFRQLKLGRWLGSMATLVVLLGLVFDAPLVQNLRAMAVFGFVFQGIAVTHAWFHARQWHSALLVLFYVLLVLPPLTIAVTVVGLVDNWLDLRKPTRSAA
ncbi:MAG: DUF2232 domain-containing protein [Gammaproteobacteria bacterium]